MNSLLYVISNALVFCSSMFKGMLMNAGISEIWALRIPFIVCSVAGTLAALTPAFTIREQDYIAPKTYSQPIGDALKAIFTYKNFTIITIGYLVMWVAFTFFNTAQVYYITNLLALPDVWVTIVTVISIGVGVCTYPLVNILAKEVGKKPLLLGACITYVCLYGGIYSYQTVISLIGGPAFAIVIGLVIAMPIAITNIIPASMFADLAQYDAIKTGKNRAGMFLAARNFANKLCQSIVVIACALLLGKGTDGSGAATAEGVQATALVACVFVACALGIYFFYNDKEIADTIRKSNEEKA
jgi:GPH family glycoside/pentoside/hexuronide:cation symporter